MQTVIRMLLSCPQHTVHNLKGRSAGGLPRVTGLGWFIVEIDDYEEQFSEMFTLGPADPGCVCVGVLCSLFHVFPALYCGHDDSILQTKQLRLQELELKPRDCPTPEFISFFSLLNCLIYKSTRSGTRIHNLVPPLTSCAILDKLQKKKKKIKKPLCLSFLIGKMGLIIVFHRVVWVWWADACYVLDPLLCRAGSVQEGPALKVRIPESSGGHVCCRGGVEAGG